MDIRFTPFTGLAFVSDAINFHVRWVINRPCVFKFFSSWQISPYIFHYLKKKKNCVEQSLTAYRVFTKEHSLLLFNMRFVWAVMLQSCSHSKNCEGERMCYWCAICLPLTCKLFEIMFNRPVCDINNMINTNFFMQWNYSWNFIASPHKSVYPDPSWWKSILVSFNPTHWQNWIKLFFRRAKFIFLSSNTAYYSNNGYGSDTSCGGQNFLFPMFCSLLTVTFRKLAYSVKKMLFKAPDAAMNSANEEWKSYQRW